MLDFATRNSIKIEGSHFKVSRFGLSNNGVLMTVTEIEVVQAFPMIQPGLDNSTEDNAAIPEGISVDQTLVIGELLQTNSKIARLLQTFQMYDVGFANPTIINRTISQLFSMFQRQGRSTSQSVTDIFAPFQSQGKVKSYDIIQQTLNLVQTLAVDLAKPMLNTLVMTQAAVYTAERNLAVPQTYSPNSHGKGYKINANFIGTPTISIGGANGTPSYNL
jgi:hypothetical protein